MELCLVKKARSKDLDHLHIGEIIRDIIDQKGLQKKWVASQLGTTPENFSNMLTRYSLSTDQLERLGKILDVNLFEIIGSRINEKAYQQESESNENLSEPHEEYSAQGADDNIDALKILMDKMADLESLVRESLEKQAKGKGKKKTD